MYQYPTLETTQDILSLISSRQIEILTESQTPDTINHFVKKNRNSDPFFIVNIAQIINKINLWRELLPKVRAHYAVKCNPDDTVIDVMNIMNMSFDCASKMELQKVLGSGTKPSNIIYANPCKSAEHIKYSATNNVSVMTFDSFHELYKIKNYHPGAKLVIRIKVDDSKSRCKFNCKFGVDVDEVGVLLKYAKFLNLNVIGVSFHVGSGCDDENVYDSSLLKCKKVYDIAKNINIILTMVDIGGGFPGDDDDKFGKMAGVINNSIKKYFAGIDVEFISEPGRFFVTSAYTLVTNIVNKKIVTNRDNLLKNIIYYLSEGVYGSFNNLIFDHAVLKLHSLRSTRNAIYNCTVFGPTCDSIDKIGSYKLPDMDLDEIIYIENMGAYTIAASSNFNGFPITSCKYIITHFVT